MTPSNAVTKQGRQDGNRMDLALERMASGFVAWIIVLNVTTHVALSMSIMDASLRKRPGSQEPGLYTGYRETSDGGIQRDTRGDLPP